MVAEVVAVVAGSLDAAAASAVATAQAGAVSAGATVAAV